MTYERKIPDSCGESRLERRRNAILDAAEHFFLEIGFEKTGLCAVVARSGGSLATLYNLFGNKHGLLEAVVERAGEEHMAEAREQAFNSPSPRVGLIQFAKTYFHFATSPRTLGLLRMVIAQTIDDPGFGRRFSANVVSRHREWLVQAFSNWNDAGLAKIDHPKAAADLFFATVLCDAPLHFLLALPFEDETAEPLEWRLAPFLTWFEIA